MRRQPLFLGGALQKPLVSRAEESAFQTQNTTSQDGCLRRSCSYRRSLEGPCDECKKEYFYKPSEVMRLELEPPESFTPHPLFHDEGTDSPSAVADRSPEDRGHRLPNLAQNMSPRVRADPRLTETVVSFPTARNPTRWSSRE